MLIKMSPAQIESFRMSEDGTQFITLIEPNGTIMLMSSPTDDQMPCDASACQDYVGDDVWGTVVDVTAVVRPGISKKTGKPYFRLAKIEVQPYQAKANGKAASAAAK